MSTLFVIPCYYDAERPVIQTCVERIRHYMPDARICVVDSNSPDRSYYDDLLDPNREDLIVDLENTQYGHGAFKWAFHNVAADFYYLIYDSLMLNDALYEFEAFPLTTVRHWPGTAHPWGFWPDDTPLEIWGHQQLEKLGVPIPDPETNYIGMMGPMWFCPRHVLEEMAALGYWDIDVPSKIELCGMERLTGIVLQHLGYDPSHSLQGVHTYHADPRYDTTYVHKLDLGRL